MSTIDEPTGLMGAVSGAITATLPILLVFGVSDKLVAALGIALVAWIGVATAWVRARVTPTAHVALTHNDVALIEAGKAQGPP